ncbi:MAG: glucose sorbosone dehydrogenase [Ilumatobacteraceae bacterium]
MSEKRGRLQRMMACVLGVVLAAGCSGGSGGSTSSSTTTQSAAQASIRKIVVDGLDGPTQIADGPLGLLLVAQLAGDENDATGEIVAVDVVTGERRVVVDGLDKPTGVLWSDGTLWVMVRRGLLSAPWDGIAATAGPVTMVLDDLAFNGRSEGTLTPLDSGRFLYETTGTLIGGAAAPGSGTLFEFDPSTKTSRVVASGLKNAYAHAVLADGRIITTEIGDNIVDAPVEEVDVIDPSQTTDLGWPNCPGDTSCARVVGPLATFPVSSTPTGVVAIGDDVFVALFVTGQLMRVPLAGWQIGSAPVPATEVVAGLEGPHTLLVRPDGVLWISENLAGRIIAVRP